MKHPVLVVLLLMNLLHSEGLRFGLVTKSTSDTNFVDAGHLYY